MYVAVCNWENRTASEPSGTGFTLTSVGLLQLVVDVVVVHASRPGPKLRPERVDIRWR